MWYILKLFQIVIKSISFITYSKNSGQVRVRLLSILEFRKNSSSLSVHFEKFKSYLLTILLNRRYCTGDPTTHSCNFFRPLPITVLRLTPVIKLCKLKVTWPGYTCTWTKYLYSGLQIIYKCWWLVKKWFFWFHIIYYSFLANMLGCSVSKPGGLVQAVVEEVFSLLNLFRFAFRSPFVWNL